MAEPAPEASFLLLLLLRGQQNPYHPLFSSDKCCQTRIPPRVASSLGHVPYRCPPGPFSLGSSRAPGAEDAAVPSLPLPASLSAERQTLSEMAALISAPFPCSLCLLPPLL